MQDRQHRITAFNRAAADITGVAATEAIGQPWSAVFGEDAEVRGAARWKIRTAAAAAGIRPASINDLYMALGRGAAAGHPAEAGHGRLLGDRPQ